MTFWNTALAEHGYSILMGLVLLQTIGVPVPAALALLIAGAAAARGVLQAPYAAGGALTAMLAGDTLMFLLGRYTGWWLLGLLCRLSLNPESCILRSADSFYRRGRMLLVIAKFIPGINTMAPPLAGSMSMRLALFLRLDLAGAALYVGSYFAAGYAFSGALAQVTRGYNALGRVVGWIVIAGIAGYLVVRAVLWVRGRKRAMRVVEFAEPAAAAVDLASGAHVYDVRSHGYFDVKAVRIRGSRRLDPHAINQSDPKLATEHATYVYCTCARQATSARVAGELQETFKGTGVRVVVIRGGLRAWIKAALPVEAVPRAEVAALPLFE